MSAPDMGSMAVTNALNPPETSTSDVPNQIPAPATPPDPAIQAANAPEPPAPAKPSVWRNVLAGALQGLAAGSSVDTRGKGAAGSFAAGAGAGANQVLNKVPAQNAELDQAKATTAIHYVNLARAQRELNLMPDDKREQFLNQAADESDAMLKSGAITPLSQPGALQDAQKTLQDLHAKNPWAVYSVMPIRGNDGTMQYSAVQFGKAPLQDDLVLKGVGPDGGDVTIPAGTPGDQVGKAYTTAFTKRLDAEAKKSQIAQKGGIQTKNTQIKADATVQAAKIRADAAAAGRTAQGAQKDSQFLDKNYIKPANDVEQSYQLFNEAYNDYKAAKAQGKELPTGAQSMLALSMHLATTFGNVKGSRVTKDMIQEHLGARGVSDRGLVAVQRLTNGDQLSPDQWAAFYGLVKFSRTSKWQIAQKEAKAKGIDISGSVPKDLGGKGEVNSTGGAPAPAPAAGGMIRARDPQGKLHQAPAGTALPAGWTQENQ